MRHLRMKVNGVVGSRVVNAGDTIDVEDEHCAKRLVELGHAVDAAAPAPAPAERAVEPKTQAQQAVVRK